ncbi:hypothetical protein ACOSP7_000494 [Xanthoceras sorbifolium]|uniref:Endoglucanase n=1 Tax=Xanthoceras sorbifolium TaxID=99658 RepID=A0ABQ8INJ2_9ROSI|nr:hypothetical protein JRO89_XS01G0363400 [Xanthoceras sorbifolium]
MPERTNLWGGAFEISTNEDQTTTEDGDSDRAAYRSPPSVEEVKQSWLLRPEREKEMKRKKKFIQGKVIKNLAVYTALAGLITLVIVLVSRRRHHQRTAPVSDNYTIALHHALMFFNAQRSGSLPAHNNVSWRGNSGLKDGHKTFINNLVGGYYDAGDAIKFTFPTSFAMTMLSWSVLEYSTKYEATGELDHVKDIIKWGTDYLLKTFNSSANSVDVIASQVGGGNPYSKATNPHDLNCWMRPEDITTNDPREVYKCYTECPALAGEMAAALASASIVFKDSQDYSRKLVHGAEVLFKFATKEQGAKYAGGSDPFSVFYNSDDYWDEFVWAGAWLYCATGNSSYLQLVTDPIVANHSEVFRRGPQRGVLSWNNKHAGAQLLLTRMRMFLGYGYPYEEMLRTFQNQVDGIMCSYLPGFPNFKRTHGGLIQLNHGKPCPLQYVVNAAFLTTLYTDYLEAIDTPGIYCGPKFHANEDLRRFAKTQMDYILGKNPQRMSYIVGFGDRFPQHVLHRGASIPKNKIKYSCQAGKKWRDSSKPNPNIIVGAMVGGPDKTDGFRDSRSNYNYTEPTIAGNAGLVAALVALSVKGTAGIDRNTIFYAIPPMFTPQPPPPPPWIP